MIPFKEITISFRKARISFSSTNSQGGGLARISSAGLFKSLMLGPKKKNEQSYAQNESNITFKCRSFLDSTKWTRRASVVWVSTLLVSRTLKFRKIWTLFMFSESPACNFSVSLSLYGSPQHQHLLLRPSPHHLFKKVLGSYAICQEWYPEPLRLSSSFRWLPTGLQELFSC